MAPAFDSRSAGKSAFVSRIAANRLRAKPACHSSSGMEAAPCGNPLAPPALFTRMSMPPRALSAPLAIAFTPSREATSPATNVAPAGKVSPRERAVTTTFAPASSKRCAIAAPMPRVPPVTSARRPMSSLEKSSLLDMRDPFDEERCVLRTARDSHEPFDIVRESIEIVRTAWRAAPGAPLRCCVMDALSAVLAPVRLQQTCWAFHGRARPVGPGRFTGVEELRPLPLRRTRKCMAQCRQCGGAGHRTFRRRSRGPATRPRARAARPSTQRPRAHR